MTEAIAHGEALLQRRRSAKVSSDVSRRETGRKEAVFVAVLMVAHCLTPNMSNSSRSSRRRWSSEAALADVIGRDEFFCRYDPMD